MSRLCSFILSMLALTASAGNRNWASFTELLLFPHQVAISDIICTGSVVSNYDGTVAEFAIGETLWGSLPSTNILIRSADEEHIKLAVKPGTGYLVFAFTNNWWSDMEKYDYSFADAAVAFLSDFITPEDLPASRAVFPECRVMSPQGTVFTEGSIIEFSKFQVNGTNYWPGTRSFITNFLDITRIQHDNRKAFQKLKAYFYESRESATIPPWVLRQLHLYYGFRYQGVEPERAQLGSPNSHPSR